LITHSCVINFLFSLWFVSHGTVQLCLDDDHIKLVIHIICCMVCTWASALHPSPHDTLQASFFRFALSFLSVLTLNVLILELLLMVFWAYLHIKLFFLSHWYLLMSRINLYGISWLWGCKPYEVASSIYSYMPVSYIYI